MFKNVGKIFGTFISRAVYETNDRPMWVAFFVSLHKTINSWWDTIVSNKPVFGYKIYFIFL